MENVSYSFKLNSHPDKKLINHLSEVSAMCQETVNKCALNIYEDIDRQTFEDVSYIIGVTHDLGKATKFFQEYIKEKDETRKRSLKAKEITHHGLLSALFTHVITRKYLEKNGAKDKYASYLPIISFLLVRRHHGNLLNAFDEISDIDVEGERIFKIVSDQLNAIDKLELQIILDTLLAEKIALKININDIIDEILDRTSRSITRNDEKLIRSLKKGSDLLPYFLMQFLYSALLDADKTDAGLGDIKVKRKEIKLDVVDRYRIRNNFIEPKKDIDRLRNDIYYSVMKEVGELDLNNRILSLNVPTGSGKTQTALSFAMKLRERLTNEKSFMPRVIYALPFLSIIDQNYGVFEDILTGDNGPLDSSILLKHHHLAEIKYSDDEKTYEADKSILLLEGWNSEIIVTTFWQVFHTLFSNRNRMLRKFNKMANAIIILDEVQSIPHKYWKLMHDALETLCQKFNSYVILVTATQPLIFDEKEGEIRELATKKEEYFKSLNRIELTTHLEIQYTLDEFKGIIERSLYHDKDKSFLIVLNTINSATEIYEFVKSLNLENTMLRFLSTEIAPKKRLKRIKEIKGKSKLRKVIVSTQLIEAGVDLDADVVYRDFAPLDSINQVAGRCNRNNLGNEKGKVHIFILRNDKSKSKREFYKDIYDPFLIDKTLEVLKGKEGIILESQFLDLNNEYYRKVREGMSDDPSEENLSYLYRLCFEQLSKEFKLIDNDIPEIDIFVEVDKKAQNVWRDYQDALSEKDIKTKSQKILEIKKDLYDYVISVPKRYTSNLISDKREIVYISKTELPSYYDIKTGFKRKNAGTGTVIPDLD